MTFEGYHFRTSSRFGSQVTVAIEPDRLVVTGRRVGRAARNAWLAGQAVVMAATIVLLAYAVLGGGTEAWLWFAVAVVVLWIGSSLGALLIWWPADLGERGFVWLAAGSRKPAAEEIARRSYTQLDVPASSISRVAHSKWYSRHGLWLVSWPWQLFGYLGPDTVVTFEADDPDRPGHALVFSLNMESIEQAAAFAEALDGTARPTAAPARA
jgi:hypothetical protein